MLIPQYWAEGRLQRKLPKKQLTVRRYGWSNESQAEAQRHADLRTQEAFARIADGQPLARREMKLAYGNEGLPIREEVVAKEYDTVLTRNSYGALCLNTPDVVFADIDFALETPASWTWKTFGAWAGMAVVSLATGHPWMAGALMVGSVFSSPLAHWWYGMRVEKQGGHEKKAVAKVRAFHNAHPDWHLRVYRTPKGLRVLVLHQPMLPDDPQVKAFFDAVGADPLYVRMCEQQQCFRARVSPKPWRIGISQRIRSWNGLPNPDESVKHLRKIWVSSYDRVAEGYSACHHIETLGAAERMTAHTGKVLHMHDALSRSREDLPLA